MRRIAASFVLLSLAAGLSVAQVYDDWSKYRTVTINTTDADGGADVAESAADFPVLVRLTNQSAATGANALAEAEAGGADIRFSNAAGDAALSYEIERWTATGADIWVRVPTVAGDDNTVIRMYWGNDEATSESDGPAVFDTTEGYAAVWHMNGAGEGGQVDETDATGGDLTAAQYNNSGSDAASGDESGVGYYRDLVSDGSTGQGFVTDDPTRANFLNTEDYTVSAWVRPTTVNHTPYPVVVSKHDNQWSLRANTNEAGPWLFFYGNDGGWPEAQSSVPAVPGEWTHVTGVRSATDDYMRIYVNGVLTGSATAPASGGDQPTTTSVAIGRMAEGEDRFWNGAIAEVRASGVARDSSWIKLEYETQKPGATALTLGTTQGNQSRPLFYPTNAANYVRDVAIEDNVPVVTGTTTGLFSIAPALPAGLNFNTSTGVISGTPTALSANETYHVAVSLQGGGTAADTLNLAVLAGSPPSAPTGVAATAGEGQAVVTWSAPLSSGSGPVTEYTVTANQDSSKTCEWTSGDLTCTVTGLTNGDAYTFTVTATNGAGTGDASAPSAAVTPATTPDAPTDVSASLVSGGGAAPVVRVEWTPPEENGGATISGYTVTSTPAGGTCTVFGAAGTTCNISTGLTYGTAYTFSVVASNTAGASEASAASPSFTPTGLLPGSFTIHAVGTARPFTFVLSPEALASEEAFTLAILDAWGRTVWSKTVRPAQDGARELTWNGRTSTGRAASAGVYVVRVSTAGGAVLTNFVEKTVRP